MTRIPVRYYDKASNVTFFSKGYMASMDPFYCDAGLWDEVTKKAETTPVIKYEEGLFLYAAYIDALGCCIVFGPVSQIRIDDEQLLLYARRHSVPPEGFLIKHRTLSELYSAISALFYFLTGKYISESDVLESSKTLADGEPIDENEHRMYMLENTEKGVHLFSYLSEREQMKYIHDGDYEGLLKHIKAYDISRIEQYIEELANKTFKKFEYLAVATITLATRAAIGGGMDPVSAYSLGNLYLQRLETCNGISGVLELQLNMMKSFTKQVQEIKKARSELSYVEEARLYILKNLNKPFTLDDIARDVNLNKSYLSRKFSQTMGVGIKEFTQIKRVEAAASMLKFSDESILTISNYLYFPSQSRFSTVFKQHFGMTPNKYREKERIISVK